MIAEDSAACYNEGKLDLADSMQDMDSLLSHDVVDDEMESGVTFVESCELKLLLEKYDEDGKVVDADHSYGNPLSAEKAAKRMPLDDAGGGMVWYALLVEDHFLDGGRVPKEWNPRDFDLDKKQIKPCRASLPVFYSDFFSSLTEIPGPKDCPRYIFHGVLNGWSGLSTLELMGIQRRRQGAKDFFRQGGGSSSSVLGNAKKLISGQRGWTDLWTAGKSVPMRPDQVNLTASGVVRLKLRGPKWSSKGWSEESPGYCFWFEQMREAGPSLSYGTNMIHSVDQKSNCAMVHMMSHRYAVANESAKDKLTYHSIVLLEWDHGRYCTVVELAFLNGLGGYKGKSNFYDDRDSEPSNLLYQNFPPEMIAPWLSNAAEIRCHDVPARNLQEFKEFVAKYEGSDERYVDPRYTFSHPARLTFRSKAHIAQYLVNYVCRDSTYSEIQRNCQTFAADLCSFLAGKKDITPFHPVNRIEYKNRNHLFLYDSYMYNDYKTRNKVAK